MNTFHPSISPFHTSSESETSSSLRSHPALEPVRRFRWRLSHYISRLFSNFLYINYIYFHLFHLRMSANHTCRCARSKKQQEIRQANATSTPNRWHVSSFCFPPLRLKWRGLLLSIYRQAWICWGMKWSWPKYVVSCTFVILSQWAYFLISNYQHMLLSGRGHFKPACWHGWGQEFNHQHRRSERFT